MDEARKQMDKAVTSQEHDQFEKDLEDAKERKKLAEDTVTNLKYGERLEAKLNTEAAEDERATNQAEEKAAKNLDKKEAEKKKLEKTSVKVQAKTALKTTVAEKKSEN